MSDAKLEGQIKALRNHALNMKAGSKRRQLRIQARQLYVRIAEPLQPFNILYGEMDMEMDA